MSTNKTSNLKNYLGFTLLPQAGVAIGLLFKALEYPQLEQYQSLILNIILGSTIIYELVGPIMAKFAFGKVKELERLI